MAFVGIGLEHSVANMFSFPCAIVSKVDPDITWRAFFANNLFLATLGNLFGGWFVGVSYHALYGIPTTSNQGESLDKNQPHHSYMETSSLEVVDNPMMLMEDNKLRRKDAVEL